MHQVPRTMVLKADDLVPDITAIPPETPAVFQPEFAVDPLKVPDLIAATATSTRKKQRGSKGTAQFPEAFAPIQTQSPTDATAIVAKAVEPTRRQDGNSAFDRSFPGSNGGEAKELAGGVRFRWCPPGKFQMGGDIQDGKTIWATGLYELEVRRPVQVSLTAGFWLCETKVTQGQWQDLMGTSPWKHQQEVFVDGVNYPATFVRYNEAISFCEKLTTREYDAGRLPSTWRYSLPTEAQWEYACRAGTRTRYPFGNGNLDQIEECVWLDPYHDPKIRRFDRSLHPVGQKKPNPWNLYDMVENGAWTGIARFCQPEMIRSVRQQVRSAFIVEPLLPGGCTVRPTFAMAGWGFVS